MIRAENEASKRAITIMGDKEIPYRLLRKVMVTCARAELHRRLVRGAPEVRAVRAARMSETGRVSMNSSREDRHGKPKRKRGRVSFRSPILAWSVSAEDEERFKRIAERVLPQLRELLA